MNMDVEKEMDSFVLPFFPSHPSVSEGVIWTLATSTKPDTQNIEPDKTLPRTRVASYIARDPCG